MAGDAHTQTEAIERLRSFIPDGFRDEDGVWHDGPNRIAFDALVARLEQLTEGIKDESLRLSSALVSCEAVTLRAVVGRVADRLAALAAAGSSANPEESEPADDQVWELADVAGRHGTALLNLLRPWDGLGEEEKGHAVALTLVLARLADLRDHQRAEGTP